MFYRPSKGEMEVLITSSTPLDQMLSRNRSDVLLTSLR